MDNLLLEIDQTKTNTQPNFGTIVTFNGTNRTATMIIDGDEAAANTSYHYLKSYSPTIGDRVFFMRSGNTVIILGAI